MHNRLHMQPIPLCGGRSRSGRLLGQLMLCACLTVGTMALLGGQAVHAQESLLKRPLAKLDEKKPMFLQADEVSYDNQNNRVTAKGNVEIYYNDYALFADKVIYDQNANTLSAEGNVRIKEPEGAVINADRMTLTDDFRDGFIRSLRVVTSDDSRIAAERATRIDGDTTVFERAVFTPCKECKDKPNRPPLWRIRAGKITHKKAEGRIYYEDAALEFFGVPVAYLPYFAHPDPTVKRRSGFLLPKYSQSDDLGFSVEVPYFFALAPNYDFTFSPRYTSERGVLWKGEWRQRLKNGSYRIEIAGIDETDSKLLSPAGNDLRGSVETQGAFKIGSWWNWGWDVTAETDDTFRRFYDLDNILRTNRVSKVYLIGQHERNYFEANIFHFGGLTSEDTSNAESTVHPVIDYSRIFDQTVLGGELSLDANALSLSREDGADSNRVVAKLAWRRTLVDGIGQVYTPFASARGDIYRVSNVQDPITGVKSTDDYIARGIATAGVTYRYPMVARTASASHVVEPVAQIVARPEGVEQADVPNEDARSLVFDDTLLFDTDKFSGYDRVETGIRANFGLQYTMQLDSGGYLRAVVGESYHVKGDNPFGVGTGLENDRSDYVAGLYYAPTPNLTFLSQARFDEEDYELQRTDLFAQYRRGLFSGNVNYANLKAQPLLGIADDREELIAQGSLQLSDYWQLFGSIRYDIAGDQRIADSLGLKYADECFVLAMTFQESFIRDRDIEPEQTITLRFELKQLGGIDFKTGIDDLIADSEDDKS